MEQLNVLDQRGIFEEEILHKFITDDSYFSSTIPYFKDKFFSDVGNGILFRTIKDYYAESGEKPNVKDIVMLIKDLPKDQKDLAADNLKKSLKSEVHANEELLKAKTEEFIKRAIHTEALILGAEAMGNNDDAKLLDSFRLSEEAQKVSLDESLGTDDTELGIDEFIDYYQDDELGLLPGIPSFDDMLNKGIKSKTMSVFLAPPGIGKSASLSDFATRFAKQGRDVVIVTLEMAEKEYYKRIHANMLDIPIWDLENIDKSVIKSKYEELRKDQDIGKIIVKEFPSYELTASKLTGYLEKLENKKGIKKPIVIVDYLQLMSSDRLRANTDPYSYIKSIASELRAVAQKRDLHIFTASQLNRGAVNNLEADQDTVSDSAGISMFSDLMIFILQTPEMKAKGEVFVKFVKNRVGGKTWGFKIGFDYSKMRYIDKFYEGNDGPRDDLDEDGLPKADEIFQL